MIETNIKNLCMDDEQVVSKLTDKTKAVFITHVQGLNSLTERLLHVLKERVDG